VSLSIVFVVGIFGSSYGTLVGGTSLITIPLLIFLGLSPHTAIGTDRLGITGLAITGWYKFHEKGLINYPVSLRMAVAAFIGSFLATLPIMMRPVRFTESSLPALLRTRVIKGKPGRKDYS
jgi:uncharacterized membrane protein YfcA